MQRIPLRLRRTVRALVPVVCTNHPQQLGIVDDVVEGVERFLLAMPTHLRAGVLAGLWTFELSSALHPAALGRPFSMLGPARAARVFGRWWKLPGPGHQLARALKMFVSFAYFEHPAVKQELGYAPDAWIEEVSRVRLERYGDEIRAHEAALFERRELPLKGGRRLALAEELAP